MKPYSMQWSSATPGLLLILLDQSGSMNDRYDDGLSKSEFACRAVNRVIDALIQRNFDGESPKNRAFVSVIGYDSYVHEICSGYLKDLDAKPLRVDEVMKKQSDGAGGLVEVPYRMPVWVEPVNKDGCTNMRGALEMAKAVVEKWLADKPGHPAPVVINISDGAPYYDYKKVDNCMDETTATARELMNLSCEDGNVLLFNALIRKAGAGIVFPAEVAEGSPSEARFIFNISSEVPEAYAGAAAKNDLPLKEGSRGCIFEADGVQLVSLIDFGSSKGLGDLK
jgi:uncharacterized protein YegL